MGAQESTLKSVLDDPEKVVEKLDDDLDDKTSAQAILNNLKLVDGASSGLDAARLAGHDVNYFATKQVSIISMKLLVRLDQRVTQVTTVFKVQLVLWAQQEEMEKTVRQAQQGHRVQWDLEVKRGRTETEVTL